MIPDPNNIPYEAIERDVREREMLERRTLDTPRSSRNRPSGFTIHIDETSATFLFLGVILGVVLANTIK